MSAFQLFPMPVKMFQQSTDKTERESCCLDSIFISVLISVKENDLGSHKVYLKSSKTRAGPCHVICHALLRCMETFPLCYNAVKRTTRAER